MGSGGQPGWLLGTVFVEGKLWETSREVRSVCGERESPEEDCEKESEVPRTLEGESVKQG